MGHASAIALGLALNKPGRDVYCVDGDGAMAMHLGNVLTAGITAASNFKHVVVNNNAHESVGAQPTGMGTVDVPAIARGAGYTWAETVSPQAPEDARFDDGVGTQELRSKLAELKSVEGPALLEIRTRTGARTDLGRPTSTPMDNKAALMGFFRQN